jgi:chemotaxis protein histidine kinase CheA
MNTCFKTLDIDKSTFEFNHLDKYTLTTNKIKTLLLRYEDLEYVTKSVLPQYGIHVNKKSNVSSKKGYGKFFLNHKEYHTIDKKVEDQIRSSPFNKIFYTEKELSDHIEEWSESSNIPKKSVRFAPLPASINQQAARQQAARAARAARLARQHAARQQAARQQAARQQAARQQAARQQAARQQAARQQATRRDVRIGMGGLMMR